MSIEINSVSLRINDMDILKDISLKVKPGELMAILGPNGSGKSSLIRIISGDILPTKGHVLIDDKPLVEIDLKEQALKRSVMSQSQQILYDYTVREIIEMGWIYEGIRESEINVKNKISEVAEECYVPHLLDRNFNILSGGEQRRVHFARTLIQINHDYEKVGHRYILLDEPTANLDLSFELKLVKLLKNKAKQGFGILLIIHDLNLASKFSDKIAILYNGALSSYGIPKDVFKSKLLSNIFGIPMDVNPETLRVSYY